MGRIIAEANEDNTCIDNYTCSHTMRCADSCTFLVPGGPMHRLVVLLLAFFVPAAAGAQTVAIAQISGTVHDESGGALPGVEVEVTQTTTGLTRFVITGESGDYVLPNLPVGPYKLVAKLPGFSTFE